MKTLKWLNPVLAIILTLTLAACGGNTNTAGSADAAGKGNNSSAPVADSGLKDDTTPVKIQYWHAHGDAQIEGLNKMIEAFQAKYPHITVEPVFQGGYDDLHKKLQAAVAAGDVPAVTNVEVASLPNFA